MQIARHPVDNSAKLVTLASPARGAGGAGGSGRVVIIDVPFNAWGFYDLQPPPNQTPRAHVRARGVYCRTG